MNPIQQLKNVVKVLNLLLTQADTLICSILGGSPSFELGLKVLPKPILSIKHCLAATFALEINFKTILRSSIKSLRSGIQHLGAGNKFEGLLVFHREGTLKIVPFKNEGFPQILPFMYVLKFVLKVHIIIFII